MSTQRCRLLWPLFIAGLAVCCGFSGSRAAEQPTNPPTQAAPLRAALSEKLKAARQAQLQSPPADAPAGKNAKNGKNAAKGKGKNQPGQPAANLPANPQAAEMLRQRIQALANPTPASEEQIRAAANAAKVVGAKKDKDSAPLPVLTPKSPAAAAAKINELIHEDVFANSSEKPLGLVNDQTYLRRAYLDTIGRAPTPEEITAFALDTDPRKRAQAIDQLLAQSTYGDNWAHYWRDVIMYRKAEDRANLVYKPLQEYLTAELNKNTPWDKLAQSFMTATGPITENGDTAIFMAQMGDNEDVVAELCRIFMGVQIQCAQCHDHPSDRWKREQFHELAAFFPRNTVRPGMPGDQLSFTLASVEREFRARGPDNGRPRGSLEHFMSDLQDPESKGTKMEPVFFVNGKQLPSGLSDLERRGAFAMWFTGRENPWFSRAIVNRLWSELTGEGFIEPVDDIGPDREITAPRALDYLAAQFVANKYDLKWLFRTITQTDAYQRASRSRRTATQTPFTANVAQRLRADQLYTQLMHVLELRDDAAGAYGRGPGGAGGRYGLRDPRFQFNAMFGYDPSVRRDEVATSIPQALALMNGQLNRAVEGDRRNSMLNRVLAENPADEDAISELYLRCLSREPKPAELATCQGYIASAGNKSTGGNSVSSRADAFEDILWALINSPEFAYRN
ncbi:MAG: DUF1553 domain-containing protein [Pirellulales bacterium]|nr:DUF1553 domain-containing protein [Pirellulales bacterium]